MSPPINNNNTKIYKPKLCNISMKREQNPKFATTRVKVLTLLVIATNWLGGAIELPSMTTSEPYQTRREKPELRQTYNGKQDTPQTYDLNPRSQD
jgi:hypothetical protein